MRLQFSKMIRSGAIASALGLACGVPAFAQEEEKVIEVENVAKGDDVVEEVVVMINEDGEQEVAVSRPKYWVGVALKDVEGDLAKHLKDIDGVFITSVYPDSPADKAGVAEGDVVLKIGESKVAGLGQMMEVLSAIDGEGEELPLVEFKLLREGAPKTLKVKLAERPTEEKLAKLLVEVAPEGEDEIVRKLYADAVGDFKVLRMGSPNTFFFDSEGGDSFSWTINEEESEGDKEKKLRVEVKQKDDAPIQVVVIEDGEKKTFTTENLDELPAEIKVKVESVMNGRTMKPKMMELRQSIEAKVAKELAKVKSLESREAMQKVVVEAMKMREKAANVAEEAKKKIRVVRGEAATAEIMELRKMVQKLKKELDTLRKELKNKDEA